MLVLLSFLLISSLTYSTGASSINTVVRTKEEYDFQSASLITKKTSKQRHPSHRFLQECTMNENNSTISCCEAGQCADCVPSNDGLSLQCCTGGFCLFCEYDAENSDSVACCDDSSNCFECAGDECCYSDDSGLETCCTGDFGGNVECCINDVFCFQETCKDDGDNSFSCSCKASLSDTECNSCEVCENMSFGVSCDNVEQGFNVGCD